ncbi:RHS repeat-associated core domain-containing protein [Marinilabilia sp.]|uniref:RHS repeat-associated core domain-containing protein n=1 Tax=Marinilabilia sp. TaxID=2021252 RepID=UPI0025BE16CC|nr:RHS repeat-associated core domain-containing protein [Marinilabilia sp.]
MPGRTFSSELYRYGYQGCERDPEMSGGAGYTTYFRALDPRIGRWLTPDPKVFPWQSPYVSMDGNPILNIDPFGDKIRFAKGNGFSYNLRLVGRMALGAIVSKTFRYYLFKALTSEHVNTFSKDRYCYVASNVRVRIPRPEPKIVYGFDEDGNYNAKTVPPSAEEITAWGKVNKEYVHPGAQLGVGVGTTINFNLDSDFESGLIAGLGHELRHVYDFNRGLMPKPDDDLFLPGTDNYRWFGTEHEKRATRVEKYISFDVNKFFVFGKRARLRQTYYETVDRMQYTRYKEQKRKNKSEGRIKNPRRIRRQNRKNRKR